MRRPKYDLLGNLPLVARGQAALSIIRYSMSNHEVNVEAKLDDIRMLLHEIRGLLKDSNERHIEEIRLANKRLHLSKTK